MSQGNSGDDSGIIYETNPFTGRKQLTFIGALVPWFICTFVIGTALVIAGLPWYPTLMAMNVIGLLASIIWIEEGQ